LTFTGLVLTFADIVIELAGGSLVLTILFIALASLVLGMGVPVTAAYLITAVVAVPALTHLGINEIAAHMIVYWLSQDSNITPPVCIAAFAGATIAKANMWRTAFASFKFAKFLYLGPFLFGYVPAFSLNGSAMDIVKAFVLIILGTWLYSYILSGIWIQQIGGCSKKPRRPDPSPLRRAYASTDPYENPRFNGRGFSCLTQGVFQESTAGSLAGRRPSDGFCLYCILKQRYFFQVKVYASDSGYYICSGLERVKSWWDGR
jgi:hypothetical protein